GPWPSRPCGSISVMLDGSDHLSSALPMNGTMMTCATSAKSPNCASHTARIHFAEQQTHRSGLYRRPEVKAKPVGQTRRSRAVAEYDPVSECAEGRPQAEVDHSHVRTPQALILDRIGK